MIIPDSNDVQLVLNLDDVDTLLELLQEERYGLPLSRFKEYQRIAFDIHKQVYLKQSPQLPEIAAQYQTIHS